MRIAFVTLGNPYDKNSWSGTDYYTRVALERQGNEVYCITNFPTRVSLFIYKACYKLRGKHYDPCRTIIYAKDCAKHIKSNLQEKTDVIFALGSLPVSLLAGLDIPIIFYTDGVWSLARKLTYFSSLPICNIVQAERLEKEALKNASMVVSCSEATVNAMISDYTIPKDKIRLVPLGANIEQWPLENEIDAMVKKRVLSKKLNILFVGVDWERKGADIVVDTVKNIYERGIDVHLNIVGIKKMPNKIPLPDYIENIGFVSKNTEEGYMQLMQLYADAHFLFVPSVGELYGLVFAEASAFGIPSVSHKIGGIPTVVKDGINGLLFDKGTSPSLFADYIVDLWKDKEKYARLCKSAYKRFGELLNWDIAGMSLQQIIEKVVTYKIVILVIRDIIFS